MHSPRRFKMPGSLHDNKSWLSHPKNKRWAQKASSTNNQLEAWYPQWVSFSMQERSCLWILWPRLLRLTLSSGVSQLLQHETSLKQCHPDGNTVQRRLWRNPNDWTSPCTHVFKGNWQSGTKLPTCSQVPWRTPSDKKSRQKMDRLPLHKIILRAPHRPTTAQANLTQANSSQAKTHIKAHKPKTMKKHTSSFHHALLNMHRHTQQRLKLLDQAVTHPSLSQSRGSQKQPHHHSITQKK